MNRMNLGCGPHLLEGWDNVDIDRTAPGVMAWDARQSIGIEQRYDFVLINHVLCTMNYPDVKRVLTNVHAIMKPGAVLQIIDLNLWTAIDAYQRGDSEAIPADGTSIDEQLCKHISGYGTRKSLFTPKLMVQLLQEHGFQNVIVKRKSEFDLRPKESLIVEGQR